MLSDLHDLLVEENYESRVGTHATRLHLLCIFTEVEPSHEKSLSELSSHIVMRKE